MPKFEYMQLPVHRYESASQRLNVLGAEGWEAYGLLPSDAGITHFLKRCIGSGITFTTGARESIRESIERERALEGKYRKKPIIVEAQQWRGGVAIEDVTPVGCKSCWPSLCINGVHSNFYRPHHGEIETLEGTMQVDPGDWIITGVMGEKYPIKDEIFKLTYDRLEGNDA